MGDDYKVEPLRIMLQNGNAYLKKHNGETK